MGQAMLECGIGIPQRYNAGSSALSGLAGVGSGGRFAWSFWYGKTHLVPINNVVFAQIHVYVDRNGSVDVNFQTGAFNPHDFNGDHGPGLRSYTQVYPPVSNLNAYSSWSTGIAKVSGRSNVSIQTGAPVPNFACIAHFDDNPWGGATDVVVNIMLTANP
jgi:hypothetical protein